MRGRCRCEVCHDELVEYSRLRRAVGAVTMGREPAPRVSARSVRHHIADLRAHGWTLRAIADSAGLSIGGVHDIASHRVRQVTLPTKRALLAVRP